MPTPKGLPYPDPDDPVSLGAADIRALAEAVDALRGSLGPRVYQRAISSPADLSSTTDVFWPDATGLSISRPAGCSILTVIAQLQGIYPPGASPGIVTKVQLLATPNVFGQVYEETIAGRTGITILDEFTNVPASLTGIILASRTTGPSIRYDASSDLYYWLSWR